MKRYNHLWDSIVSFENLLWSTKQAQKGKRFREDVLKFNYSLESNIQTIQDELQSKTYLPGAYRTFEILDPKPRMISAAPYRDRVVHHAICRVIEPLFERTFIPDSYANRVGYGSHRALRRFTKFARSSKYVLQCDIRKYFSNVDHEILKSQIRKKIKCYSTLNLIYLIIDNSNDQIPVFGSALDSDTDRPKGLPIGNLTSQFMANVYLNGFDHFVKEHLHVQKYLRYVDDFALFSDDWTELHEARVAIEAYLSALNLVIHPIKSQLFETRLGATFVGFRVLGDRIRVRNDNLRRVRRRFRQLQQDYANDRITIPEVIDRLRSWDAHLKHGNTYRLRQQIFQDLSFSRVF